MTESRWAVVSMYLVVVLAAVFLPECCDAAVAADRVTSLPGWAGALPSRHYSGYLPVRGGQAFMHYYLQLSEGDPAADPVTLVCLSPCTMTTSAP